MSDGVCSHKRASNAYSEQRKLKLLHNLGLLTLIIAETKTEELVKFLALENMVMAVVK